MTESGPSGASRRSGALFVGTLAVVLASCGDIMPVLRQPLAPFALGDPGQAPWLAIRAIGLAAWLISTRATPVGGLVAVLATTATLVARGLFLPWLIVVGIVLWWSDVPVPAFVARLSKRFVAFGCAAALAVSVALALVPRAAPPSPPTDAPSASAYWRGRGNLYRARHAARAWSHAEGSAPALGTFTLAELETDLGQKRRAVALFERLAQQSPDEGIRNQARRRLAALAGVAP